MTPANFLAAKEIGEQFRSGHPVWLDLTGTPEDDARRLIDFAAGLCVAGRGTIERRSNFVLLVRPPWSNLTSAE